MRRTFLIALAMIAATMAVMVPSASAATSGDYCYSVLIDHGNTCQHGVYHGLLYLRGYSEGTAYAGVWVNNSNRVRISRDAYSPCSGCSAVIDFRTTGDRVGGFAALHNASSFISRFRGNFLF